jgi:threonine/homoserine/homoserine lactone efflux protein
MGSLLVELLPFAAGLAVTPAAIAAGILFLSSKRPLANAIAFAAAFSVVYAAIAGVVLAAAQAATEPLVDERTKQVITLAVGLLLLGLALVTLLRQGGGRPERPRWMEAVEQARPAGAFGLGLALAVLNPNVPILLAGLTTIVAAEVSGADHLAGVVFLLLGSQLGLAGPILWYVVRPASAGRGLDRLKGWLARHARLVDLGVLGVFGALFTLKGLAGL